VRNTESQLVTIYRVSEVRVKARGNRLRAGVRVWFLCLRASLPGIAQQNGAQPANSIEKARQYLSLNMYDNARQTLTAALAENEFDPLAHFLMGKLWLAEKDWLSARKEFLIAYTIQPLALSAAGRMCVALANQFQKTGERELRVDALQYAKAYLQRPQREGADPFEDAGTLATLDSEVTAVQAVFLGISGRWVTGAGGEYFFQEAGSSGVYIVRPHGTIQLGNLRRTAPETFEGIIATSGCAMELTLHESDDGESLSGTIRVSQPPERACRRLAMQKESLQGVPGPFSIHRQ
jgi:hypothetical protein